MIKDGFILLKTTGNESVFINASSIDGIKGGKTFTTVEYNGQKKDVQEKMDCVLRLIIEAKEG